MKKGSHLVNVRIVLVGTTHPGNIGATARAMKNMGISDLRLVNPRYFPHDDATARASGAENILAATRVISNLAEAVADCSFVAGASARARSIDWPSLTPRECAMRVTSQPAESSVAVVFGPEKSGLENADLDRCNALLTIPTDPSFSSLNIAMAVQIVCYEILLVRMDLPELRPPESPPATAIEMEHFYRHLEDALIKSGFLDPANPRLLMRRLRRLFTKSDLDKNEVNILRGILTALEPASKVNIGHENE